MDNFTFSVTFIVKYEKYNSYFLNITLLFRSWRRLEICMEPEPENQKGTGFGKAVGMEPEPDFFPTTASVSAKKWTELSEEAFILIKAVLLEPVLI